MWSVLILRYATRASHTNMCKLHQITSGNALTTSLTKTSNAPFCRPQPCTYRYGPLLQDRLYLNNASRLLYGVVCHMRLRLLHKRCQQQLLLNLLAGRCTLLHSPTSHYIVPHGSPSNSKRRTGLLRPAYSILYSIALSPERIESRYYEEKTSRMKTRKDYLRSVKVCHPKSHRQVSSYSQLTRYRKSEHSRRRSAISSP